MLRKKRRNEFVYLCTQGVLPNLVGQGHDPHASAGALPKEVFPMNYTALINQDKGW